MWSPVVTPTVSVLSPSHRHGTRARGRQVWATRAKSQSWVPQFLPHPRPPASHSSFLANRTQVLNINEAATCPGKQAPRSSHWKQTMIIRHRMTVCWWKNQGGHRHKGRSLGTSGDRLSSLTKSTVGRRALPVLPCLLAQRAAL